MAGAYETSEELVSVNEKELAASEFEPPRGFQKADFLVCGI